MTEKAPKSPKSTLKRASRRTAGFGVFKKVLGVKISGTSAKGATAARSAASRSGKGAASAKNRHRSLGRLQNSLAAGLLLIISVGAVIWYSLAADVTNRSDQMSNQAAGAKSMHRISFNLSASKRLEFGKGITVNFPAGFVDGGLAWTTSDFSFTDSVARTVAAVNQGPGVNTVSCTNGTNNVGVAVDTSALSFRLTPCGSSFVPSSYGAMMTFTIDGEPFNGTISNPSAAGSYTFEIRDAAGDCTAGGTDCQFGVSILGTAAINVTAQIGNCGNGILDPGEQCDEGALNGQPGHCSTECTTSGGSGGSPTCPEISSISASNLDVSSATINWMTSANGDSLVRYGLDTNYGQQASSTAQTTTHAVGLSNLSPGVTYHYQVCSQSVTSCQRCSGDQTFTTTRETPPIFSNVQCVPADNSLTFTWNTDEAGSSYVDYDLVAGPPYANSTGTPTPLVTVHSVDVTGLKSLKTYHYRVRSADSWNNEGFTQDATCTTTGVPPQCLTCSQLSYDFYIVNPDSTERHEGTAWVIETDLGNGVRQLAYEDKSVTPGDPLNDHNDIVFNVNTADCHKVTVSFVSNHGIWDHQVRLATKVNGVTQADTLLTDDSLAVVGTSLTFNAADLVDTNCPGPPVITNIKVSNIGFTSATVSWTTNRATTSWVDFGTVAGPPYAGSAGTASPLVSNHSVNLINLTPGTTYDFSLRSADADGLQTSTGNMTFQTGDNVPPVITNVQATNITVSTAHISWDTNKSANSKVLYGLTTTYGSTVTDAASVTSHGLDLTGLQPNTTYHYQVQSVDKWNNQAVSADYTFKTALPPPPVITNVQATNITESSARISWTTSTAADSKVEYGLTTTYGSTATTATLVTGHLNVLSGLTQGTTYHYRVSSKDAYGQTAVSADFTFKTVADTVPPANPTNLTAVPGNKQVSLTWTNPTDADFQGVVLVRSMTGFPTSPTDGLTVYTGKATSYKDNNVSNGILYYYTLFAYDEVPNYSSGVVASATPVGPLPTQPPGNVTNLTATPGDSQVTLNWTNPTDASFTGTLIVRKALSCPTSPADGTVVYDGLDTTRVDTGLNNGTLYCYVAYAHDAVPNYASGVNASATPAAPTVGPGPVTNLVATAGDSQNLLTWTNPTDAGYAGTLIVRKTGGYPTSRTDGTVVFNGLGNNQMDTGLTNNTTYYYAAYAFNSAGLYSSPAFASATPQKNAGQPPVACADTDGGLNYYVKGTVTDSSGATATDSCADGQVKEYYCDDKSRLSQTMYKCDAGYKCSDGHCVPDVYNPTPSQCGNGICETYENSLNCPSDCPVTPAAPPVVVNESTVPPKERITSLDLRFFATSANIPLRLDASGNLQVYNAMTFSVLVPTAALSRTVESAFINLGVNSYAMMQTADGLRAAVTSPAAPGPSTMTVIVNYANHMADNVSVTVTGVGRPVIYGDVTDDQGNPLAGARITLFADMGGSYGIFNGQASGQPNPYVTDSSGRYAFVVPVGQYYLLVDKDGYNTEQTLPFPMDTQNVLTRNVQMIKLPPTLKDIVTVLSSDISTTDKATQVAGAVAQQATFVTRVAANTFADAASNPNVQSTAQNVVAPTATALTVANVLTAASALPYLNFVLSFLTHPLLLIARRKRRRWGVVYDSLTKLPIDLAIVRLMDAKTNRIIRSAVTDKDGRYFFMTEAGTFKLVAVKPGFVFPTSYMRKSKEDNIYVDLYHGEPITVSTEANIAANIPLDPVQVEKTPLRVTMEGIARRMQRTIGVAMIIVMVVVFALNPSIFMGSLLGANIVFYWVFKRLAMPRRPKSWGVVYDEDSYRPLSNVVVRIFESKFNKLLETQVTDIRGRYAFLVGNNVYYVTFEKPGYQKQQKGPVDFVKTAPKTPEAKVIALDVKLKHSDKTSTPEKPKDKPTSVGGSPLTSVAVKAAVPAKVTEPAKEPDNKSLVIDKQTTPPESVAPDGKGKHWELDILSKLAKSDDSSTNGNVSGQDQNIPPKQEDQSNPANLTGRQDKAIEQTSESADKSGKTPVDDQDATNKDT